MSHAIGPTAEHASSVDAAAQAALEAFAGTRAATDEQRASWLRGIADELDANVEELVSLADEETHLGPARLTGEVARTTGQLRMFASVIEEGSYLEATIDHGASDAVPPRPDLRRILIPVGPVAVYAASNFPFAFSVAGGDTASALAVGCPVVVKAHPGHPRLSRRTAELVAGALERAGAPDGTFSLVEGFDAGVELVEHPAIAAASFTGSVAGGRALFDRASARPEPIPFYGELGSINPVVVTPAADAARGEALAAGLAASFQLGVGQFCTKPGVVLVPRGSQLEAAIARHVTAPAHAMLSDAIADRFGDGLIALAAREGVDVIAGDAEQGIPSVLATDSAAARAASAAFFEEVFGPVTLLVRYDDMPDAVRTLSAMGGSLTVTVHAEPEEDVSALVDVASHRAGRVLFGGWPTGVAVTWSQHHGGPYPATTSLHTSVGATAVRRFQRPIAFQDAPQRVLPDVLRDSPTRRVPRRVDGALA